MCLVISFDRDNILHQKCMHTKDFNGLFQTKREIGFFCCQGKNPESFGIEKETLLQWWNPAMVEIRHYKLKCGRLLLNSTFLLFNCRYSSQFIMLC